MRLSVSIIVLLSLCAFASAAYRSGLEDTLKQCITDQCSSFVPPESCETALKAQFDLMDTNCSSKNGFTAVMQCLSKQLDSTKVALSGLEDHMTFFNTCAKKMSGSFLATSVLLLVALIAAL